MQQVRPSTPIKDLFEEKARAGDGSYAIAYALLTLVDEQVGARASQSSASFEQMHALQKIAEALTRR